VLGSVWTKTLRDLRWSLLWWSVGLAALVAVMAATWPSVRDNEDLDRLVNGLPPALRSMFGFGGTIDFTSATGYLGSRVFSFMAPLLLLIVAIGAGARAIAGEEERGTLDLLLSLPLSRRRLVLEKAVALGAEVSILSAAFWLALWIGARAASMPVGAGRFAGATLMLALLALAFGTLALALGAATGRRTVAAGVAAAAAVAGYLVQSLAPLSSTLDAIDWLSPFHYYAAANPLQEGLQARNVHVLSALAAAGAACATVALERRDLSS